MKRPLGNAMTVLGALTLAATTQCGGKDGLPTADDSKPSFTTYCATSTACIDACFEQTTDYNQLSNCMWACPVKAPGVPEVGDVQYTCTEPNRPPCLVMVQSLLGQCLDPPGAAVNGIPPAETSGIPAELVGTWATPTATLAFSTNGQVVFENHATMRGCKVMTHLEGTAGMRSNGSVVIAFQTGPSSPSFLRDCNGQAVPREIAGGLYAWYKFEVTETTAGVRLSVEGGTDAPGPVQGSGTDHYYRVGP